MPSLAAAARRDHLRRVPLFSEFTAPELDALGATTRSLRAREVLFDQGDPGSTAYVVVAGRLSVTTMTGDGRELVLHLLEPGEVLGELALLDGGARSATVKALEPTRLLAVERREFLRFLEAHPQASLGLLARLAGRVRHLSTALEDSLFLGLQERLSRKLLALAKSYGRPAGAGVLIDLKLSQQGLGELVGFSRESTNKQLRQWTRAGVLRMERGLVTVLDPRALERLASSPLD